MWSGRWLFVNRIDHLHRIPVENCALLGYYAARSGNLLPTFRDNLSGHAFKYRTQHCPETSVINSHFSPRNNPQERSSHVPRGGILKSHIPVVLCSSKLRNAHVFRSVSQIWFRNNNSNSIILVMSSKVAVVCLGVLLGIWEILGPLKPELNPICYLLALLGAHHFLHVSRIRVNLLTFRLLMSYIYGAPILDVSRSHTTTQHSR